MSDAQAYPPAIRRWHEIAAARDPAGLDDLLADEIVFVSPVVHTPPRCKPIAKAYLSAAIAVLGESLRYVGHGARKRPPCSNSPPSSTASRSTASTSSAGTPTATSSGSR